jgi:hypothetical protein
LSLWLTCHLVKTCTTTSTTVDVAGCAIDTGTATDSSNAGKL